VLGWKTSVCPLSPRPQSVASVSGGHRGGCGSVALRSALCARKPCRASAARVRALA